MKKSTLAKTLVAAIILPVIAGCVERQVVYRPAPPPPNAVVVDSQPPPPQVEVIPPQPDVTYVWVPGVWEWHGRWVWAHGHWGPRPHAGAVWVGGHWEHHRRGYVWIGGYWR